MAKRHEKAKQYNEKYKAILKPCPVCGNTNIQIISDRTFEWNSKDGYSVICTTRNCEYTIPYTSVKKAIEKWNSKGE